VTFFSTIHNKYAVIPDKRRSRADPESITVRRRDLRWIPGLRCAAPGMTARSKKAAGAYETGAYFTAQP
jgi:hypothetical protein